MKCRLLVLVFLLVTALVTTAHAQTIVYNFPINTEQEVPAPNIPPGEIPAGNGMVTLDTVANTIDWVINYEFLTGPIVAPGAHFHGPAIPGDTAGVQLFLSDGDPPEPATGQLTGSASITEQQKADIIKGLWYVNIHTAMNGPGEIRGQVVPEPTGLLVWMMMCGWILCRRQLR